MSYMMMHGYCVACRMPLQFNPDKVPSIRVEGKKEPLCRRHHPMESNPSYLEGP